MPATVWPILFAILSLLYLSSFVFLALIRIGTGLSIQRLGYLSLKRIVYSLNEGVRIEIRDFAVRVHRPSYARPTWFTLRFYELKVIADPSALSKERQSSSAPDYHEGNAEALQGLSKATSERISSPSTLAGKLRGLLEVQEKLKSFQGRIEWLRFVDLEFCDSVYCVNDVCSFQLESCTVAVDTRHRAVERGRLFRHKEVSQAGRQPAEWLVVLKNMIFAVHGKDSIEVLDTCAINVHGLLQKQVSGLRDTSVSLKLGRVYVPYDDALACWREYLGRCSRNRQSADGDFLTSPMPAKADGDHPLKSQEPTEPSRNVYLKKLFSSVLAGVQEMQLAASFIGTSTKFSSRHGKGQTAYVNFAMNEFGIDLFRIEPKSPAHRMYFPENDMAHQALLAAISIAISLDAGKGKPDRLVYIPMATTTIKTTLPFRTLHGAEAYGRGEPAVLIGNLVLTSPSIDLDLKRMSLALALFQGKGKNPKPPAGEVGSWIYPQSLPRISMKISVQEPVARIVLPKSDAALPAPYDYDLLIFSISSASLDVESLQPAPTELQSILTSTLRVSSHHLYYQSASDEKFTLLILDAFEMRLRLSSNPEIEAFVVCILDTFSVHLVRPEIIHGISQVLRQVRSFDMSTFKTTSHSSVTGFPIGISLLRRLPSYISHARLESTRFGAEVAGMDPDVSCDPHGIAVQIDTWSTTYTLREDTQLETRRHPYRTSTGRIDQEDGEWQRRKSSPLASPVPQTEGRRLALHVEGLNCFMVNGLDHWEPDSFLFAPKLDTTIFARSQLHGRSSDVTVNGKALLIKYSLYRSYAILLAGKVAQTILSTEMTQFPSRRSSSGWADRSSDPSDSNVGEKHVPRENVAFTGKIGFVQVKADLPHDPSMLLRVSGFEYKEYRGMPKTFKTRLLRLCTETLGLKNVWSRVFLSRTLRVDVYYPTKTSASSSVCSIDIASAFGRFAVPHQLAIHQVVDNLTDVTKATQLLRKRILKGQAAVTQYEPGTPKVLPKISFRSKVLILELEDGVLDWKLGLIYRVGLTEQKQRLAREEAFHIKTKGLQTQDRRRDPSRHRHHIPTQFSRPSGHHPSIPLPDGQVDKIRTVTVKGSQSSKPYVHRMRYDIEGLGKLTDDAKISSGDAWSKLQRHDTLNWKKRIDFASRYQSSASKDIRRIFGDWDEPRDLPTEVDKILDAPCHPALLSAIISDFHVTVDRPSFPVRDYPRFLHRVGKGIPLDMVYSLLIPTSLQFNMGETRVSLRKYPLPLLHIPGVKAEQSPHLPSWSLSGDFVVAEEFHGPESMRRVQIEIVPYTRKGPSNSPKALSVEITRTVSPVKTYSELDVAINTHNPTGITWGTSYQPAIQDMMQIIEKFTKPRLDSSRTIGFWDKIRLTIHARIRVAWTGGGGVHLRLKGSRDPYVVSGHGAGFVMCFREDVKWDIHQDDDPKKFMTVSCNEYILAVPDYSSHARQHPEGTNGEAENNNSGQQVPNTLFKKIVMKLSGHVRWLAGLVFERDCLADHRSFNFKPHFNVIFKRPAANDFYDALDGFRSHHLHLSLAVIAPVDRDWSIRNSEPSSGYNSMHTSPRFFTHFFDWWSLFSGVMSLPIRQGKLFAGMAKPSKKFSRHLATIKYNLLLSPFLVSHIYKHGRKQEPVQEPIGVTGLKIRIDSFMLDLHQRREEFAAQGKGRLKTLKTSGMRINQAQLDFISADIRAISAFIGGRASSPNDNSFVQPPPHSGSPSFSDCATAEESTWIDAHDFIELDEIPSNDPLVDSRVMPLAFSPRFTYLRQTDHQNPLGQEVERTSHFGNEPTHYCIISGENDPSLVQNELVRKRLKTLRCQLELLKRRVGEEELRLLRDGSADSDIKQRYELLQQHYEATKSSVAFMDEMLQKLPPNPKNPIDAAVHSTTNDEKDAGLPSEFEDSMSVSTETDVLAPPLVSASSFKNCFIIHNVQWKWNNALRDIVLHYGHQVNQRRGFIYYLSRRAVRFIIDIVQEQERTRKSAESGRSGNNPSSPPEFTPMNDPSHSSLDARIEEILNDGKEFVDANDPLGPGKTPDVISPKIGQTSAEEFTAQDSYHLRLIAPQIQLQSKKNATQVVLVTAREMELRVVQIMDKGRISDEVSGLVQRRFSLDMDGVQFFVTNVNSTKDALHLEALDSYGTSAKSKWPPWAPLETNFDFEMVAPGLTRIVQKTSASLRYDKYNNLRLKYNSELSDERSPNPRISNESESRMDHLWVNFPHVRAICDSSQYYAIYIIVLDLLMYSEPLEKIRNEKLEKIMLATDFSDLSGSPEMVADLQKRIRDLEETKAYFQLHAQDLDGQGWHDLVVIEQDLLNCEDELFFLMKAIATSQRKRDDRSPDASSAGLLRWYLSATEIVWLMVKDGLDPLMEIQLKHATYERTDNSDGSNYNVMEIEQIRGLNLVPNAAYPEMIAPYIETSSSSDADRDDGIKMFKVRWYMLEAIAGIPVLDQFEINLFPVKLQIEREIGVRIFEYIFPGHEHGGNVSVVSAHGPEITPGNEEEFATERTGTRLDRPSKSRPPDSRHTMAMEDRDAASQPPKTATTSKSAHRFLSSASHDHGLHGKPGRRDASTSSSRSHSFASLFQIRNGSQNWSSEDMRSVHWTDKASSLSSASGVSSGAEKGRRFELHRRSSKDSDVDGDKASDDLSEMVNRASNFMTLAYVKIPSVVLCLSYKGRNERNLEDIHNLVFRMPALEYRNKTWSNLDLALRLKKDVIKALISHTGAIIGNKLSHHRPTRPQRSGLREAAASSSIILESRSESGTSSRASDSFHERNSRDIRKQNRSRSSSVSSWYGASRGLHSSASSTRSHGPLEASMDGESPLSTSSLSSL